MAIFLLCGFLSVRAQVLSRQTGETKREKEKRLNRRIIRAAEYVFAVHSSHNIAFMCAQAQLISFIDRKNSNLNWNETRQHSTAAAAAAGYKKNGDECAKECTKKVKTSSNDNSVARVRQANPDDSSMRNFFFFSFFSRHIYFCYFILAFSLLSVMRDRVCVCAFVFVSELFSRMQRITCAPTSNQPQPARTDKMKKERKKRARGKKEKENGMRKNVLNIYNMQSSIISNDDTQIHPNGVKRV